MHSRQLEPSEVSKVEHLAAKEPHVHDSEGTKLDELMLNLFWSQILLLKLYGLLQMCSSSSH